MRCRRDHSKVGEQVRSSIKLAKIAAITLGFVEKENNDENVYKVQASTKATAHSRVQFNSTIYWKGRKYSITTCDCTYFRSTLLLCPCACAACQRTGVDIDDSTQYHPRWWIGYHPLYHSALLNLGVADYDNAPWVPIKKILNAGSNPNSTVPRQESEADIILLNRTDIFNGLPNMKKWLRQKGLLNWGKSVMHVSN